MITPERQNEIRAEVQALCETLGPNWKRGAFFVDNDEFNLTFHSNLPGGVSIEFCADGEIVCWVPHLPVGGYFTAPTVTGALAKLLAAPIVATTVGVVLGINLDPTPSP